MPPGSIITTRKNYSAPHYESSLSAVKNSRSLCFRILTTSTTQLLPAVSAVAVFIGTAKNLFFFLLPRLLDGRITMGQNDREKMLDILFLMGARMPTSCHGHAPPPPASGTRRSHYNSRPVRRAVD